MKRKTLSDHIQEAQEDVDVEMFHRTRCERSTDGIGCNCGLDETISYHLAELFDFLKEQTVVEKRYAKNHPPKISWREDGGFNKARQETLDKWEELE